MWWLPWIPSTIFSVHSTKSAKHALILATRRRYCAQPWCTTRKNPSFIPSMQTGITLLHSWTPTPQATVPNWSKQPNTMYLAKSRRPKLYPHHSPHLRASYLLTKIKNWDALVSPIKHFPTFLTISHFPISSTHAMTSTPTSCTKIETSSASTIRVPQPYRVSTVTASKLHRWLLWARCWLSGIREEKLPCFITI